MAENKFITVLNTKLERIGIPVNSIGSVKEYKELARFTRIYRNDGYKSVDTNESVEDIIAKINAVK
ncbi:hypothetical protein BK128_09580 [Viridibacillus sp. FSL H7-0596]|uniref:hypothetical protein n=1 Tax=Viridibacillus sp. FSL H7-0596 TaxID=1928923 RepID=UPI00096D1C01|nr:hypothetical protein [Viridibacillus sp. FSL H7-0596]OMC86906.1 hypothetical protein BK128_09580 [Viridibacillus sp. FSL H7-0596]